jgi:hypothetical protein
MSRIQLGLFSVSFFGASFALYLVFAPTIGQSDLF